MYQTVRVKLGHTTGGEDGQIQPEAKVDAFLDEIEGETLGQMLEYLSSELDSSEDSEVVRKRRSQQIDHVFCEITKAQYIYLDSKLLAPVVYLILGFPKGRDSPGKRDKLKNLPRDGPEQDFDV